MVEIDVKMICYLFMYKIVIMAIMTAATHSITVTDTIAICLDEGPPVLLELLFESSKGDRLGAGLGVVLVVGVVALVVVVHVITEM